MTTHITGGLTGYNSNTRPLGGSTAPFAQPGFVPPEPSDSTYGSTTWADGLDEDTVSAFQDWATGFPAAEEVAPGPPPVGSVMGGDIPETGVYSDGSQVQYDPFTPPVNGSSQDIQRWFDQFTKGTRDFATAEEALNWQMGTGKYAPGQGLVWDPTNQSYVTDPSYVAPGATSDLGGVSQTGPNSFSVGASPGSSSSTSGSGESGGDVNAGQQELMDLIGQQGDAALAAQEANDVRYAALETSMKEMAAESARSMAIMMGLMNGRREEDENRGSFTYNALGGR